MFLQILRFEISYRLRRPLFYVYFALAFAFSLLCFSKGMVPARDTVLINSPVMLAEFITIMSIFMMLVSASFMGMPLYRDIEYGTKEYYLSYPITKPGYFWGRFLGSFLFVALTGAVILPGAWLGSRLGPAMGWQAAGRYGPNHLSYYLYPYFTQMLPTLLFTSCFFFGLVAVFRNVKVIYSSGMYLFLGYLIGNFFLRNIHNNTVIYLSDPFNFNGLRVEVASWSPDQQNHSLVHVRGLLLTNRTLWLAVSLTILLVTYIRFSFEKFFSGRQGKRTVAVTAPRPGRLPAPSSLHIQLQDGYYRRSLYSLTRIELLNIIRDSYFWIIISGGLIFMAFVFWQGPGRYNVQDYPRTIYFMDSVLEMCPFFLFLIIVFYTGETVHREKLTRYHLINDTLPPPTWILNGAKLLSLLTLAVFLALVPVLLGLIVQLSKGYRHLNLPQYASSEFVSILPRLIEMVLLCYAIHITVDNKFAAHGIAISIWSLLFGLTTFNFYNYNLLLYSYTPRYWASDMDGIGHMVRPVLWYQAYWTAFGCFLVIAGSLFYARGTRGSFLEKARLAGQRFQGWTRIGFFTLLTAFLLIGGYIYYNVSYLNEYLKPWERDERAAQTEKTLRQYEKMPLPRVTRVQLQVDLFPGQQRTETNALVTLANKTLQPIDSLLLDAEDLAFDLYYRDAILPYRCPLYFNRGSHSFFSPAKIASDYRFYRLPSRLMPGDSIQLRVRSTKTFTGFQNDLYAASRLHNGTLSPGDLPGMGYDAEEELDNNDKRKEHGLSPKTWKDIPQDDSIGMRQLNSGFPADLISLDITVGTSIGQIAMAPGRLEKEWTTGNRHYFHYVQQRPVYLPYFIVSAAYASAKDTVILSDGRKIDVAVYYHPTNDRNIARYMKALKDGLHYFSEAWGPYPFDRLSLLETSNYGPFSISTAGMIAFSEPNAGWNADISGKDALDYIYYHTAILLAQQWWEQQVPPNNTVGSPVIRLGLSGYAGLALVKHSYGDSAIRTYLDYLHGDYGWGRRTNFEGETDLLHANKWYLYQSKAPFVLHDLARKIGTDSLNAALRDFCQQWQFRSGGPYAGAADLYSELKRHTPDSLRSYLYQVWEKKP